MIVFALALTLLETFVDYQRYARLLRWMTLALLAYAATTFVVHLSWGLVLRGLIVPAMPGSGAWMLVAANFGTTISPYLFYWQASQEAEEAGLASAGDAEPGPDWQVRRIRLYS